MTAELGPIWVAWLGACGGVVVVFALVVARIEWIRWRAARRARMARVGAVTGSTSENGGGDDGPSGSWGPGSDEGWPEDSYTRVEPLSPGQRGDWHLHIGRYTLRRMINECFPHLILEDRVIGHVSVSSNGIIWVRLKSRTPNHDSANPNE